GFRHRRYSVSNPFDRTRCPFRGSLVSRASRPVVALDFGITLPFSPKSTPAFASAFTHRDYDVALPAKRTEGEMISAQGTGSSNSRPSLGKNRNRGSNAHLRAYQIVFQEVVSAHTRFQPSIILAL